MIDEHVTAKSNVYIFRIALFFFSVNPTDKEKPTAYEKSQW